MMSRFAAFGLVLATSMAASAPRAARAQEAPDFLVTVRSAHGFDETLSLLKQAIEGQNLMVVHEVNPQQMLRMIGMRVGGMRQVLFFHPRYMRRIIRTNRHAGIEPPLKLLVMERPDGRVMVRYHDPVHQFAPYAGLEELAAELGELYRTIVGAVTR